MRELKHKDTSHLTWNRESSPPIHHHHILELDNLQINIPPSINHHPPSLKIDDLQDTLSPSILSIQATGSKTKTDNQRLDRDFIILNFRFCYLLL
ncbi:hypothetical protein CASFOL_004819 [Castilleja foliolosa]|uniref:Uncharacterized protein n=1 Tax=Castilleja foliolosa TaxID=1961234 RepID=A0ABD3EDK7_9LAMI